MLSFEMKLPTYFSIFRQQDVVKNLREFNKFMKGRIDLVESKSTQIKIWKIDDKLCNKAII